MSVSDPDTHPRLVQAKRSPPVQLPPFVPAGLPWFQVSDYARPIRRTSCLLVCMSFFLAARMRHQTNPMARRNKPNDLDQTNPMARRNKPNGLDQTNPILMVERVQPDGCFDVNFCNASECVAVSGLVVSLDPPRLGGESVREVPSVRGGGDGRPGWGIRRRFGGGDELPWFPDPSGCYD